MNKYPIEGEKPVNNFKHVLRIMRITLFLLFFGILFSQAANSYSQGTAFTLHLKSTSIKEICEELEKKSDYRFIFAGNAKKIIHKKVNLMANSQNIEEVLNNILSNTELTYQILDHQIVIYRDETKAIQKEIQEIVSEQIAQQQKKTITGRITDNQGEAIIGANIIEKGTTNGTVTDMGGRFNLDVSDRAILQISYLGYIPQEITIGNQTSFNIELAEDSKMIDEVVVIGYGTVRKSDLTGAVSSLSAKQFQDQPITRLDQALNGRIPGVMINTNSGAPEQSIHIRIRGANSIYGGNDPLYIVDGIPNGTLFNNLDPNDIQSIEVLKDASATAIYGSRGANGVVLVTTKRGAEGKSSIHFETTHSWSTLAKKLDMLNASDYAEFYNQFRGFDFYTPEQISNWKTNGGIDWQDLIFRTAYTQNHKLSISGGTSKLKYIIGGNVLDAQGILLESESSRYSVRSNISADATDWFKINLDLNAGRRKTNKNGPRGGIGSIITDALTTSPTITLKDDEGNWVRDNVNSIQDNPYGRLIQDQNKGYTNYVSGNLQLSFILPVKGLTLDIQGASNYRNYKGYWLNSSAYKLRTSSNRANNNTNDTFDWFNINQLNYNNQWGDHRLSLMGVFEASRSRYTSMFEEVINLRTESGGYWNLNLGDMNSFGNSYSSSAMISYIGRTMYQFKDKYLFTATIRRDGSSKFQGSNKWGNFPSFAFAWRASEESFIKDLSLFDMLKFRVSYGITGNQAIDSYSTLGLLSEANYGWGTATNSPGYWPSSPATPDLTWEKTYQWDAGLDIGFFNNRLSATVDLYSKNTKDLLLQKPIPYYDGGGTTWVNQGEVENRGVEVSLSVIPIQSKNAYWESTFNASYSKNEVVDLGGEEKLFPGSRINQASINTAVLQVGKPLGSIYGFVWEGLWSTDEAAEAAKWGQKPGDNKFKEKNVNYTLEADDADVIGQAFPDVVVGWNNTISWRNFDFNFFFQGAFGADRLNLGRYITIEPASDSRFITAKDGYYDMWTPENQDTKVPNPFSSTVNTRVESTQYLEKANYIRLKNISISYLFSKDKTGIGDLKLSFSAQNVFTFTSYTGYDPEGTMESSGYADTNAGIDGLSYPIPRTFTVGLSLTY